ncbi:hypothetical protein SAMN05421781_0884 [Marinococcus luteus]|uniref:Uncharacterized protein n=1 Tax=Marinococcus luteus TaxID=1122204 RepID=A0A1H2RRB2_9BACI|nr:hypothetical protein [Marinococcus luteus]SDW22022.1 hypothetical protein SAMN05421781_0884 [Marinococcus luteus]
MKKGVTVLAAGIIIFITVLSIYVVYPWLEEMENQTAGAEQENENDSEEEADQEHQLTKTEKKVQREGEMKNYIAARHDRWNELTGYGGEKMVEAENIQEPEEKIEKLKSLAAQTDNPDLARDLRNAAGWNERFQQKEQSDTEEEQTAETIHRIFHDLDVYYNGHGQEPFGVTHVDDGQYAEKTDI